jgi:hypothetical protein
MLNTEAVFAVFLGKHLSAGAEKCSLVSTRRVMGLKNTRAFLVEREKPWWRATRGGSSWWSGGMPKGKPSGFSGTSRGR